MCQIKEQIVCVLIITIYDLDSKFDIGISGENKLMHRCYVCLAALISVTTIPVSALAEVTAQPATTHTQSRNWADTANDAGFYIDLPALNDTQLMGLIKTCRASLTHREAQITRYLDENRLDAKDALITAILPGGLLYALVRKGNLTHMRTELAEITQEIHELSDDLLAMQVETGELTVAQLQ
jgi:hypothetical protein